jgi:tetratricopeptide (TPR) repeat protein
LAAVSERGHGVFPIGVAGVAKAALITLTVVSRLHFQFVLQEWPDLLFAWRIMAQGAQDDLRIIDQFDLEVFWAKYGKRITMAVVAVLAVGLIVFYRQHQSNLQAEQAAESLGRATDVASLERVIGGFPGSPSAAEAMSRLADVYYRNGRYADAVSTYQRIEREFPGHPLAGSAKLGVATVLEAQGNWDGAKAEYSQILNANSNDYVANAAKLGLARCSEIQGQKKEAMQYYEEVAAAARNSPWFQQAYLRLLVLNRDVPPENIGQPSAQSVSPPSNSPPQLFPTKPQ